jgi:hypothetical protein
MSNSRHTPGPWDIKVSMGQDPHNSGVNISVKSGDNYLADIFPTYPKRSESCANARLIAAAPELDAYRQYIEDNLDRIERGGWTPVCFNEFRESEWCANHMKEEA